MLLKCNSLLQYLTAHCKSLKWIWHSFGTNNFIHECVIQFSLKLCHAQQEDIFFLLWQWYLQHWMTPPVQEKHEIAMSMERWFRKIKSVISTAKVTELLLSLIVTGYLVMLSASWPTEGQIRLVNIELWSHYASSFCHEFAAWTEQFHKQPQSEHVTPWMRTTHVLNTNHKFYHYSQLGRLPRLMRWKSGDEVKSGEEVTMDYSMHLQ